VQIDIKRISSYLDQIIIETEVIAKTLARQNGEILRSDLDLRSLKYSLIVISESIANTLHHLLAKNFQIAVSGYKEVLAKASERNLLSKRLSDRLLPFIRFRNMLVHQYWEVDEQLLLNNLRDGLDDFRCFVKEIKKLIEENES